MADIIQHDDTIFENNGSFSVHPIAAGVPNRVVLHREVGQTVVVTMQCHGPNPVDSISYQASANGSRWLSYPIDGGPAPAVTSLQPGAPQTFKVVVPQKWFAIQFTSNKGTRISVSLAAQ